ncbi:MAG TPA: diguanylate cyclase [Gammaproteobacteria bacterium]
MADSSRSDAKLINVKYKEIIMPSDGQDTEQWKQKYYDQLDLLEQKEHQWELLENTLKRALGRLSLAAEGQHKPLDRQLSELRNAIKYSIDHQQLDAIVDDISHLLTQFEEKQASAERKVISALETLFSSLEFPAKFHKLHKKLLKRLSRADDEQTAALLDDSIKLLKQLISYAAGNGQAEAAGGGLFGRLFKQDRPAASAQTTNDTADESSSTSLQGYKSCLLEFLQQLEQQLDADASANGQLAAFKISTRDAHNESELRKLSSQLSTILQLVVNQPSQQPGSPAAVMQNAGPVNYAAQDTSTQPSIQELLIRLLEQLIVPSEFQPLADKMKQRLEAETQTADWKQLLKDVAQLINTIRTHLQNEKHEFEDFLQQVTDRLKLMDQFLQSETSQLDQAQTRGADFDQTFTQNVDDIRLDVNQAIELSSLKTAVNSKLDTISTHIVSYRQYEANRVEHSRQQVHAMQSRMQTLEQETQALKQTLVEKNRQAMFDTLTAIPNRLFYEQRAAEEISRWKRFANPLSLVVWDIDFFKKVNDIYGHKAGDKVLKTVAQLLNQRIRETDFLARYGGEEFVMLLPGTQQDECLQLVNELRQQVADCGFHYHGEAVTITVSCGISSFREGDSLDSVFDRADRALYKAKENGRNQCMLATD